MWRSLEEMHLFLPQRSKGSLLGHAGVAQKSPLQKTSLTHTWAGEAKLDNTGGGASREHLLCARHELDTSCVMSFSPHDDPVRWV